MKSSILNRTFQNLGSHSPSAEGYTLSKKNIGFNGNLISFNVLNKIVEGGTNTYVDIHKYLNLIGAVNNYSEGLKITFTPLASGSKEGSINLNGNNIIKSGDNYYMHIRVLTEIFNEYSESKATLNWNPKLNSIDIIYDKY